MKELPEPFSTIPEMIELLLPSYTNCTEIASNEAMHI